MPNRNVHTVHIENGWTNRYENSNRTLENYDKKAKAQVAGRERAIQNNSEHIIHGLYERVKNKNAYRNDICLPRNKN